MPVYTKTVPARKRILVGIPYTGLLRAEWVVARYSQVIPCNWSQVDIIKWLDPHSPLGFLVADARNVVVDEMLKDDFEWLLFIDHDVVMPPGTIVKINEYMLKPDYPIVSGLYFTKSVPSEPLVYRKRGTGYYNKWKLGDKVMVDGVPMGLTLIHRSIIDEIAKISETYTILGENRTLKRIFETPCRTYFDPETHTWNNSVGTEDLEFCSKILENDILEKAGWSDLAKEEYPFLVDTSLFCRHIDFSGVQYPSRGEELEFMNQEK